MSNLVEHFRRELEIFETDTNYINGMCKVAQAFADMDHSGGSASVAIPQIYELLQFKNLSPLTDNPEEWFDHGAISGRPFWQNKRNSEAFSEDGGKTYYLLSERRNVEPHDDYIFHESVSHV